MADRPLRPATDRRLGRPLPYQQANRPQAHPEARLSSLSSNLRWTTCGISCPFEQLFPTSGQITYVLLTRSPLTTLSASTLSNASHDFSRSTPSRASTECWSVRLACIKHAASVHPEPGSNPPLNSQLTSELLSTVFFCSPYLSFRHSSVVKVLALSSTQRTEPTYAFRVGRCGTELRSTFRVLCRVAYPTTSLL